MCVRFPVYLAIATVIVLALTGAVAPVAADVGAPTSEINTATPALSANTPGTDAETPAVDDPSAVTITVGASGSASAPPDLAVIDVAVEASASSADAARAAVADNVTEMRAALAAANVSDEQIRTTYFVIYPERDTERADSDTETITYRAVHGFAIRVPVDDAGSVVDAAIAGGATRINWVRFTLSEETSRELRNEALAGALDNARADADVIADETGVEIDAVTAVETADGGFIPVFEAAEHDSEGETIFDPGPVTVTAYVTVTYTAS